MVIHYAVDYDKYGETRTRSLCGRSRANVVNVTTVDTGQNVSYKPEDVTVK